VRLPREEPHAATRDSSSPLPRGRTPGQGARSPTTRPCRLP
jgi:hypothetical protein